MADDRSEAYSTRPSTPVDAPEEDDRREIIFDNVEPTTSQEIIKPPRGYGSEEISIPTSKPIQQYDDYPLIKGGKSSLQRGSFSRVGDIFATLFNLISRISESAPLPKYFRQAIFLLATVYWLTTSLTAKGAAGSAATSTPATAQARKDKKSAMRALNKAKKYAVMSWWWLGGGKGLGYV